MSKGTWGGIAGERGLLREGEGPNLPPTLLSLPPGFCPSAPSSFSLFLPPSIQHVFLKLLLCARPEPVDGDQMRNKTDMVSALQELKSNEQKQRRTANWK